MTVWTKCTSCDQKTETKSARSLDNGILICQKVKYPVLDKLVLIHRIIVLLWGKPLYLYTKKKKTSQEYFLIQRFNLQGLRLANTCLLQGVCAVLKSITK